MRQGMYFQLKKVYYVCFRVLIAGALVLSTTYPVSAASSKDSKLELADKVLKSDESLYSLYELLPLRPDEPLKKEDKSLKKDGLNSKECPKNF